MSNKINENIDEKANWRQILNERAYKKNIVEHSETGKTPYGILSKNESHNAEPTEEKPGNESSPNPNKRKQGKNRTQRKKLKTDINESQLIYNTKMKEGRR